jgi:ABC-type nitrate/sulfonate/bicarbonate transport system substrate-binding protein
VELHRPESDAPLQRGWQQTHPDASPEARALRNGDVDVVFHKGSRGLELAAAIGAKIVFDVGRHPDPKVRINNGSPRTLTVDAGLLDENLDLAARLVREVLFAGRWAEQHPLQAIRYIARETSSSEAAVELAYGKDVGQHLQTDLEPTSIDALEDFKDFLLERGFLPRDFDVRSWIDPRPLALARERLGAAPERRANGAAAAFAL